MATKRKYDSDHVVSRANAALCGNERVSSDAKPGHTIRDWIDLHQVKTHDVLAILNMQSSAAEMEALQVDAIALSRTRLSGKAAWTLAADAMTASFSPLADQIGDTERECEIKFEPVNQPYIADNGWRVVPTIHINFKDDASSLLNVAHEFSHATQLSARSQEFIPPVIREIAAFLGELAMLTYLKAAAHSDAADVFHEWQRQNSLYLGDDVLALKAALAHPQTPYDYRHNYPCARILAAMLFRYVDRHKLSNVFDGTWTLSDCLDAVRHAERRKNMKNYFPEIPEKDTEYPAVEAYRTLGMMAYLDLDYWHGQSEKSIEAYFGGLLDHMKSNTLYVVVGDENKPIGYATWNVSEDQPDEIEITRQAAPFGDHLAVQRSLRARLPGVKSASTVHERSARKGQMAW